MHQEGIQGVADAGTANLGVMHDRCRLLQIGSFVNVGVANADAAGDGGHCGPFLHQLNQPGAASGHQQVDVILHLEHGVNQGAVRVVHVLHGVGG